MRLIDADALMKKLGITNMDCNECQWGKCYGKRCCCCSRGGDFEDACIAIENAPTIEQPKWIPVSERLPDDAFGCLVTVWDTNPVTMDEFENVLPYFVGWDGEQWNDADGEQCPFEVIAWMPLPKAYEVKYEKTDNSCPDSRIG